MPTYIDDLDPKTKRFLSVYPVRAPVKWRMEKGKAVLVYKKNLSPVEKRIQAVIGGPDVIRRPLDEVGTDIWLLCDGQHNLADVCTEMDAKYQEDIEPVFKRVWQFIQMLLDLRLMTLSEKAVDAPGTEGVEGVKGYGEPGKIWSDKKTRDGEVVDRRRGKKGKKDE